MVTNDPLAERYTSYATKDGVKIPPRAEQEGIPGASTDEGDVSYEVPSLQAVFKLVSEQSNHNAAFAKAAGTMDSHKRTIAVSKRLAMVAIDYLSDEKFRKEVKRNFHSENHS